MAIPIETIEEVRSKADIVGVIGEYVVLRKRGRNFTGLCPFHSEKTPSFSVSPDKEMFYCFGCGVGGNVFTFLMKIENFTFEESVRSLGSRFGISVPERTASHDGREQRERKERIYEALEEAAEYFHDVLLKMEDGEEGRKYLQSRGYDIAIARSFRIGWSPRDYTIALNTLKSKGYSDAELEAAGLAVKRDRGDYYSRFRGRILFPIISVQNKVLGFGGRIVNKEEDGPKYLNSPETDVYKKSEVLYGIHAAKNALRDKDAAIIVEGYFDCIALHKYGFQNVVATCGTALTVQQVRILSRYTKNLYPLFDADEAGRKAAARALEVIIAAPAKAYYVALPAGDPDSFLAEQGAEKMTKILENAPPLLQTRIEEIIKNAKPGVEGRQEAMNEVARLLSGMADRQAGELYLRETAPKLFPGAGAEAERLFREETNRIGKLSRRGASPADAKTEKKAAKIPAHELYLVALCMVSDEALANLQNDDALVEEFEDEIMRRAAKSMIDPSFERSTMLDNLPPEYTGELTGLIMNLTEKADKDKEFKPIGVFNDVAKRIRGENIAKMKKEIQSKLANASPEELTELLRRKSELAELERFIREET